MIAAGANLRALERKGHLTREDMKSRSLRPTRLATAPYEGQATETSDGGLEIPVVDRVVVGLPLLDEAHVVDRVRVDPHMLGGGREIFGLKVRGDSMIGDGIVSGDIIFVRKQRSARRGEIVVALVGDEAVTRHYFPERDYVRFEAANKSTATLYVRAVDFKTTMLLGVVVGVFRRVISAYRDEAAQ